MIFHFDHIQLLRSGGNADLYLARRRDTGEIVVVKYLRDYHDITARRLFAREIRILSRNLQGLVTFIGRDTRPEPLFYVMSYLPSGSAARWIGRLNAEQLRFLAVELAQGLGRLHATGIAHGDIKPENVLLDSTGRWRIADPLGNGWGCTRMFSEHCGGTPGYWAPEIRAGYPISAPGDCYSYGATILHVATGRRPRDGDRLDHLAAYYAMPREIHEVVVNACNPVASLRPSMRAVERLLGGATMTQIRREHAAAAAGLMAIGVLAAATLRR